MYPTYTHANGRPYSFTCIVLLALSENINRNKVGGKKIQLRFYESVRSKSSTLNTEEGVSLPSDNLPEQESVLTCLTPHQQTKPHATNPPEIAKTDTLQRPGELSHTLRS